MDDIVAQLKSITFDQQLRKFQSAHPVGTDDVLGAIRTLFDDVRELHDQGQVAQLDRVDLLTANERGELRLAGCPIAYPTRKDDQLRRLQIPISEAVRIVQQVGVMESAGQKTIWFRQAGKPIFKPSG